VHGRQLSQPRQLPAGLIGVDHRSGEGGITFAVEVDRLAVGQAAEQLDTFAMALLAAIGELPDTIMDR
jgi:hypothetical protein